MEYTIDIDTGGTFTDGFIRGNGRTQVVKVDTTPHDLTLCFMNCIEQAAKGLGLASVADLLVQTRVVRLSSTIGTNTLIEGSGPKLGLLVTKGTEKTAYAISGKPNSSIGFLVPEDLILGLEEEINELGNSVKVPRREEVLSLVKILLERGARRIVLSLCRSPLNPIHERLCKDMVLESYPSHFLGSVPVVISTEISAEIDDWLRTNAALINAYLHREMVRYLYKADEEVRNRRYKWPLLIVHATGGVARVAKTKAIDTLASGPASGLFGASFLARLYDLQHVITFDAGGTSTDVGFVSEGKPEWVAQNLISGIPVTIPRIETVSIGSGGGSIARPAGKKIQVGPDSAGATPGPACYGLGGVKATVTDAWLALGYIDPAYFLGGRRKLIKAEAESIIKEKVADPLKISVCQAANLIIEEMQLRSATFIEELARSRGKETGKLAMFAFGGAAGLSCWSIAKAVGIPKVYLFPFGAVFSAFGSSCMDVLHSYNMAMRLELASGISEEFNRSVKRILENAYLDMEGEGLERANVSVMLELSMNSEISPEETVIPWPSLWLEGKEVDALLGHYEQKLGIKAEGKVFLSGLSLKAVYPLAHPEFSSRTSAGQSPEKAFKGERQAFWGGELKGFAVYEQKLLRSGNVIKGPGIVESEETTILVPPGAVYRVDQYLNAIMEDG